MVPFVSVIGFSILIANTMEQDIVSSVDGLLPLEEQWGRLHASAGGSLFQSFDWIVTWCETYADRFLLRILVYREEGQLVGVFPFFVQQLGFFPLRISRLRFVGEYGVFGEYLPLVMPAHREEVIKHAVDYLSVEMESDACTVADFANYPATSPLMAALAAQLCERGFIVRQNTRWMSRYLLLLPPTWEQYLQSLRTKERRDITRTLRKLQSSDTNTFVLSSPEDCTRAMSDLERLHSAAWKTRSRGGHFIEDDGFLTFWRTVVPKFVRKQAAWFAFCELQGERVAGAQCFALGTTCHGYIAGRSLHRKLETLALGKAVAVLCIAEAIRRQCTVLDFLGGEQEYKRRLGAEQAFFARMLVYPKGVKKTAVHLMLIALRVRFFLRHLSWRRVVATILRTVRASTVRHTRGNSPKDDPLSPPRKSPDHISRGHPRWDSDR
jgi:hypothetical protein